MSLFRYNDKKQALYLYVKIITNAKRSRIDQFIDLENRLYLKIYINDLPQEGKANQSLVTFLAKEWKILKQNITIIQGETSKYKTISIKNIDPGYLNLILNSYIK